MATELSSSPIGARYGLQAIVPDLPPALQSDPTTEHPEEDFIKLLVAQLQNQDPEKPVDGTQLISQLAQMNAAVATQRMTYLSREQAKIDTAAALVGKPVSLRDPASKVILAGKVESVDYVDAMPHVTVGGKRYPVDSVLKIDA